MRAANTQYDYNTSEYVLDYDDGIHGILPKRVLGKPTAYDFEGHIVMGVEHADEYLRIKYGNDYMVVPPHDNQRQHNFFYLDYDLPYKQYQDKRSFVNHDSVAP